MATATDSIAVLSRSSVSPFAAAAASEIFLPLTYLDMIWLHFFPIERLIFYEIPQLSRAHFIDRTIPQLQSSLSLTLEYFLPLAGHLIVPASDSYSSSNSRLPEIRYIRGDSVKFTVAECNKADNFNYLVADDARNCLDFYSLIPELFKLSLKDFESDQDRIVPVLAIQVTLFQNFGISIGISNHHAVGDASTIFRFMKTWANFHSQINQDFDSEKPTNESLLVSENLPFYDRSVIEDENGLASIFFQRWNHIIEFAKNNPSFSTDEFLNRRNKNVRRTFVVSRKDVEKLKSVVMKNGGKTVHLSSFTVTCAYVWRCLVKSGDLTGEEVGEEESEHFSFFAECRGRMDPPLPENYFGNCLTHCITRAKHGKLVGEEGFGIAAELIGETIERLKNSDTIFRETEKWLESPAGGEWKRDIGVAGSPRYNYYTFDFGWGKPVKFEFVSIDLTGAISLNGCRESDGAVEVGLSLLKPKMDAFAIVFTEGLSAK